MEPPSPSPTFALRVQQLPLALSADGVRALLGHFGAVRVLPSRRTERISSGQEPGAASAKAQSATALFTTIETRENARRRLHGLELAGQVLQATIVDNKEQQPPLPKSDPPPLPPGPPPAEPPPREAADVAYAPVPLAPHLGLHFAPSPMLEYKYPRATESIVRNIANALIALPRFYTQVLHLMNKMNLPTPFEDDAIPGRFSASRMNHKPLQPTPPEAQIVEEDDDSEEDQATSANANATPMIHLSRKRSRNDDDGDDGDNGSTAHNDISTHDEGGHIALKRQPTKAARIGGDRAQLSKAFIINDFATSDQRPPRPGVMTEAELVHRRRSPAEMADEPAMKNYSRGSPSCTVLVRNVAEAVDEDDLRSVFAFVLSPDSDVMSIQVDVSSSTQSATVVYPTIEIATAAVDQLHGVVLGGLPLVVCFEPEKAAEQENQENTFKVIEWTPDTLRENRLDAKTMEQEKAMKNYKRGERSSTLYIKNLAKTVQLNDLRSLFAATLPQDISVSELIFRHFTEGRMKCQAFVSFPSEDMAEQALLQAHGVVLHSKPLIVSFRRQQNAATTES